MAQIHEHYLVGFIFLLFHISVKTSFPGDIEFITLLEGMLVNITMTSVFLSDMHHREDERKMPNVVICCYSIYVMIYKNNPIHLQYALLKSISSAFLSFQRWFWNADGIPCHFSFRFFFFIKVTFWHRYIKYSSILSNN